MASSLLHGEWSRQWQYLKSALWQKTGRTITYKPVVDKPSGVISTQLLFQFLIRPNFFQTLVYWQLPFHRKRCIISSKECIPRMWPSHLKWQIAEGSRLKWRHLLKEQQLHELHAAQMTGSLQPHPAMQHSVIHKCSGQFVVTMWKCTAFWYVLRINMRKYIL